MKDENDYTYSSSTVARAIALDIYEKEEELGINKDGNIVVGKYAPCYYPVIAITSRIGIDTLEDALDDLETYRDGKWKKSDVHDKIEEVLLEEFDTVEHIEWVNKELGIRDELPFYVEKE
jgi:hypothetical protein